MTVIFIRAHKRYGVCRGVRLHHRPDGIVEGLLIELSQEGCRVSNVQSSGFAIGDTVVVEVPGGPNLTAHVRWQHDGMVGLRLCEALHKESLSELVTRCRRDTQAICLKRA